MKAGAETLERCQNHYILILNANKRLAKRITEQREQIKQLENELSLIKVQHSFTGGSHLPLQEAWSAETGIWFEG